MTQLVEESIPRKVYQDLRIRCGLSPKTDEAAKLGLVNSVYQVLVKDDAEIVGMGRIIGDGGCFSQVVDICVLAAHQGKGIGKMIMGAITNFIESELPPSCYVSLIADGNASFLYEKFGFKDTLPVSRGMYHDHE